MTRQANLVKDRLDEKIVSVRLEPNKLVAPSVGIFDEPTRCYTINKQWAKYVMGMVSLLADTKLWQGAYEDDFPAIIEVLKFLQGGDCVNCDDIENCLNASPVTIAQAIYTYSQLAQNQQERIEELDALYDDVTPQSVFPAIPNTPAQNDPDDDAALCYAVYAFIQLYQAGKGAAIEANEPDSADWLDRLIEAGKFIWSPANYIAGAIWDHFTGSIDEPVAQTALQSSDELDALACCLKTELRQAALTETTWNSALASCNGTNDLAALADDDLANTESFLFFLDAYNEVISRQVAGDDIYCPCDFWCIVWQGADLQNDWFPDPTVGAIWNNNAWESTNTSGGGCTFSERLMIHTDWGISTTVRHVEFVYDMVRGSNTNQFRNGIEVEEYQGTGMFSEFLNDLVSGNAQLKSVDGNWSINPGVTIDMRASCNGNDPPGGKVRIKKIVMRGTGNIPDSGRECWSLS